MTGLLRLYRGLQWAMVVNAGQVYPNTPLTRAIQILKTLLSSIL